MRYEIEIKRTSYIDFMLDAEDEHEAFEKALDEADIPKHERKLWQVSYCEETEGTK